MLLFFNQRISQHYSFNHFNKLPNPSQRLMKKLSLQLSPNLPEVSDLFTTKIHQNKIYKQISKRDQMMKLQPKHQKKQKNNRLKNLLSQMEDGSVACATITTSKEEPNASDAKRSVTSKITKASLNTLDKWKTKKLKPSSPDKMGKCSQDQNSISNQTTEWLKSTASTNKIPWETGLAKDASTITTPSERNATCAIFPTLKAIECCTPKLNKDFS